MEKLLRKLFKFVGFSLLLILFATGFYVFVAVIFSRIPVKAGPETTGAVSVFIMSNGFHTDLVVPVRSPEIDWTKKVRFLATDQDTAMHYLGFGWGDREFYLETPTWADLKFKTAFEAVFGSGGTAIHTTFYRTVTAGPDCIRINLGKTGYMRLIRFINNSFSKDRAGNYIKISAGYGYDDAFYDAGGRYSLFKTCNTWTNDGLKACGQKACLWTPFAQGIMYQYEMDLRSGAGHRQNRQRQGHLLPHASV